MIRAGRFSEVRDYGWEYVVHCDECNAVIDAFGRSWAKEIENGMYGGRTICWRCKKKEVKS